MALEQLGSGTTGRETAWSRVTGAEKSDSDCAGPDLCLCTVALPEPSVIPVAVLGWVLQGLGGLVDPS